mmetsp:Transcript_72402/g.223709  ORF Transcript_72402/g.223709 Transcript_72402/m.223709 type:complete len:319 (-) Transcript_72402:8-964(-)
MPAAQSFNMGFHGDQSAFLGTGGLGGVVGVAPYACPSRHRLRVESHANVEHLADALQDVPRHPQVVGGGSSGAGAYLKLPLSGRILRVDAANLHARVEARTIVALHDISAHGFPRPRGTVVRIMLARVASLWPAQRPIVVHVEQVVLLLNPEPWVVTCCFGPGHDRLARHSGVEAGRRAIRVTAARGGLLVCVSEHEDVRARAERVPVDPPSHHVHVRVVIPSVGQGRQLAHIVRSGVEGRAPRAETKAPAVEEVGVDPDVFGLHHPALIELHELAHDGAVERHGPGPLPGRNGGRLGAWIFHLALLDGNRARPGPHR